MSGRPRPEDIAADHMWNSDPAYEMEDVAAIVRAERADADARAAKEFWRGYLAGVLLLAIVLVVIHAYEVVGCPGLSNPWFRLAMECRP